VKYLFEWTDEINLFE